MPQMAPCWWLIIQFSVVFLFLVVFVEVYYSFSLFKSGHSATYVPKNNLLSNYSLKGLLNE